MENFVEINPSYDNHEIGRCDCYHHTFDIWGTEKCIKENNKAVDYRLKLLHERKIRRLQNYFVEKLGIVLTRHLAVEFSQLLGSEEVYVMKEELLRFIPTYFTPEYFTNYRLPDWKGYPLGGERITLLEEAVSLHSEGKYHSSIAFTFSQIGGLVLDYTGRHREEIAFYNLIDDISFHSEVQMRSASSIESFIKKIYGSKSVQELENTDLNRNSIMHGRDLSYGTEWNSICTLLLLEYVLEGVPSMYYTSQETYLLMKLTGEKPTDSLYLQEFAKKEKLKKFPEHVQKMLDEAERRMLGGLKESGHL